MKARHHALDVMPIEGVEVTLDQGFFGRHFICPPSFSVSPSE
jgi:hypothetical protein